MVSAGHSQLRPGHTSCVNGRLKAPHGLGAAGRRSACAGSSLQPLEIASQH